MMSDDPTGCGCLTDGDSVTSETTLGEDADLSKRRTIELGDGITLTYHLDQLKSETAERLIQLSAKMLATLLKKNADYGSTANRSPLLAPHVTPVDALLVRMSDKIARMVHLRSKGVAATPLVADESYYDTVGDTAGYSLLVMAAMDAAMEELNARSG